MSRYLWVLVACLTAAGMVIALFPREEPPRNDGTVETGEVTPTTADRGRRIEVAITFGGSGPRPDGVSDWFRRILKESKTNLHDPDVGPIPSAPSLTFKDGDRRFELHGEVLGEFEGGELRRTYRHAAFDRLANRHQQAFDTYASNSDDHDIEVRDAIFQHLKDECRASAKVR
jgi:hypothetical protein